MRGIENIILVLLAMFSVAGAASAQSNEDDFGLAFATEPAEYESVLDKARQVADSNKKEIIDRTDVKDLFVKLQQVDNASRVVSNLTSELKGKIEEGPALLSDYIDEFRRYARQTECGTTSLSVLRGSLGMPREIRDMANDPRQCSTLKSAASSLSPGNRIYEILKLNFDQLDKDNRQKVDRFKTISTDAATISTTLKQEKSQIETAIDSRLRNVDSVGTIPWVIGVICVFCIAIMVMVKQYSDLIQLEWVSTGQATQFVTIILLLSIITMLSINDRIGENTLGTLLGGVAGYVLAQGVGRSSARQTERDIQQQQST